MAKAKTQAKKTIFVLFGATGDLAVKKIFPALDRIFSNKALGFDLSVIGVSRRDWKDAELASFLENSGAKLSPEFLNKVSYAKVDIEASAGYAELKQTIERAKGGEKADVLVYFSLAPRLYIPAFKGLCGAGVVCDGDGKLLIEKPFGTDEKTAKELDKVLSSSLKEDQIYRIDHYLGKETAIALMDLQEKTPEFGKMISKERVSSIKIRIAEAKGIDGRGASYDEVGAFRDVGQNHILELLAIASADISRGGSWQKARAEAIELLAPPAKTCELSRRGQYEGYHNEKGVPTDSETETAFEVVASFSKGKLQGVPLMLEAGKFLDKSEAFIEIAFKDATIDPRKMSFFIQPEQRIDIEYQNGTKDMFIIPKIRDAYENVILAALRGSEREFVGRKEIEALWRYTDHVVACWDKVPLEKYSLGKSFKFGFMAGDFRQ